MKTFVLAKIVSAEIKRKENKNDRRFIQVDQRDVNTKRIHQRIQKMALHRWRY